MAEFKYEITEGFEAIPELADEREALEIYYRSIGERIKKARDEAGLTQAKLAEYLGLSSPSAIANYEAGTRQIPVHLLLDFSYKLGKPLEFFLGPNSDSPLLIMQSVKIAMERLTEARYIEDIYDLSNGKIENIEGPVPLIPIPAEYLEDYNIAFRIFNEVSGLYSYYICKWYKPILKRAGIPFFKKTVSVDIDPDDNDWVIAEKGDSGILELIQYKNVTPSQGRGKKGKIINVRAIVLARLERLVK